MIEMHVGSMMQLADRSDQSSSTQLHLQNKIDKLASIIYASRK